MSYKFDKCIENRGLVKEDIADDMILKEIDAAEHDLSRAKETLEQGDSKWATIQGYYSMFHSARALIFSKGYRERSHYCLRIAVKELFVFTNELKSEFIDFLEDAKSLREQADYGLSYYPSGAKETIDNASRFLEKAKELT